MYDVAIVGGGITGLYCALKILTQRKFRGQKYHHCGRSILLGWENHNQVKASI